MMKTKRFFKIKLSLSIIIMFAGVTVFGYPLFTDLQYADYQSYVGRQVAAGPGEHRDVFPKEIAAQLSIPRIGLQTFVLYGTSTDILKKGPGLYEETPLPGAKANVAIGGHRTTYGHPFLQLDELAVGDKIIARTERGRATYEVAEKKRVSPTDLSVLDQTGEGLLTLTTCDPVGSAAKRLVVVSKLVSG